MAVPLPGKERYFEGRWTAVFRTSSTTQTSTVSSTTTRTTTSTSKTFTQLGLRNLNFRLPRVPGWWPANDRCISVELVCMSLQKWDMFHGWQIWRHEIRAFQSLELRTSTSSSYTSTSSTTSTTTLMLFLHFGINLSFVAFRLFYLTVIYMLYMLYVVLPFKVVVLVLGNDTRKWKYT